MPRGGKRPKAGRKPGSVTKKTREVAERLITDGGLPMLEIMVRNARHFQAEAEAADAKIAGMGEIPIEDPAEAFKVLLDEVKRAANLRGFAQKCAADAAPFLHARLSPVEPTQKVEDHVPLAQRLKAYGTENAIEQSEGKVVEMKRAKRK